ncbi:MAG: helix-turn-helix transcriptional regulator, partial [Clostridia bacterium]|nr:helix-turn-helix transcriptional regulator [Clostridia bacterium]
MRQQSYYRLPDVESNNYFDESHPILVNCVGYTWLNHPFRSSTVRQDYYLQYMDKGKLRMRLENGIGIFSEGQFILHEAGIPYEYSLEEGEIGYYWAHFTGSYADRLVRRTGLEYGKVYTAAEGNGQFRRIFPNLFREFMMRSAGFEDACGALLSELLIELARAEGQNAPARMPEQKFRFSESLAYIHNRYTADISISALASMEHLSVSRYRDVFRQITGVSPGTYIISLRMQRACELLTTTDYTVTQISSLCGYADVLYFIRLFRQKMGVPP